MYDHEDSQKKTGNSKAKIPQRVLQGPHRTLKDLKRPQKTQRDPKLTCLPAILVDEATDDIARLVRPGS